MTSILLLFVAQLSLALDPAPVAYACHGASRATGTGWCPEGAWYHSGGCYPACTTHPDDVVCSCESESSIAINSSRSWEDVCRLACPTGTRVSAVASCGERLDPVADFLASLHTRPTCGHGGDPPCFIWQRIAPCDRGFRIDHSRCMPLPPGANAIIAQIGDWFTQFAASGQQICIKAFEHIPVDVSALNQRLVGLGASSECARNFVSGFVCSVPQLADLSGGPDLVNIILAGEADLSCLHVPLPLKPLCAGVVILNQDVVEAAACVLKAVHAGALKGLAPGRPTFDPQLCTQMGQIAFSAAQSRLEARVAKSPSDLLIVRIARASLSVYNSASSPNSVVNALRTIDACVER